MPCTDAPAVDSIIASPVGRTFSTAGSSSKDDVIGISLICEDCSEEGESRRTYRFWRERHRAIDLVRASNRPQDETRTEDGSLIARATFSNPVISRKHAQIYFSDDGLVTLTDVGSMHGTFVQPTASGKTPVQERLQPNKPYTLHTDDVVHLGKTIDNGQKCWKPLVIQVKILTSKNCMPPYVSSSKAKTTGGQSSYGIRLEDDDDDVEDDDDESSDSSSSQQYNSSSPDSSPLMEQKPLEPVEGRLAEGDSGPSQPVIAEEASGSRGFRSILPLPFHRIHGLQSLPIPLPSVRSLPSLRELGFFGATKPTDINNDSKITLPSLNTSFQQPPSASPAMPSDPTMLPPLEPSPFPNDMLSPILSFPENQLGLLDYDSISPLDALADPFVVDIAADSEKENSVEILEMNSGSSVADKSKKPTVIEIPDSEGECSMDISPGSSRHQSPTQQPQFKIPENRRSASQAAEDMRRRAEREFKQAHSWPTLVATSSRRVSRSRMRRRPHEKLESHTIGVNVAPSVPDNMRQELEGMREDIRHLSALVHDTVFKLQKTRGEEARSDSRVQPSAEQSVQVDATSAKRALSREPSEKLESAPSLKRKRSEDEIEVVPEAAPDASRALPVPSERPTKRLRSGFTYGGVARSAATAAGYTSLGAVLTWAALAYV